jgi:acyl carrier protein
MTREEHNMGEGSEEIFIAIQEHLVARGIDKAKIVPEAQLLRDLDLDSLDTVELTVGIEDKFSIEIPDEDLEGVETISDIVLLIFGKLPVAS